MEQIRHDELISKKHKKTYRNLNYVEHLLILTSAVTGCLSISAVVSLAGISLGIAGSAATIKICVITARIKNQLKVNY